MIPALTLIIAAYVVTRLTEIIRAEYERIADDRYSHTTAVQVVAMFALVVTVLATAYVFWQAHVIGEQIEETRRLLGQYTPVRPTAHS